MVFPPSNLPCHLLAALLEGSEQMRVPPHRFHRFSLLPFLTVSESHRGACASTYTWVTALAGLHHQRWVRGAEGDMTESLSQLHSPLQLTPFSTTHRASAEKRSWARPPTSELRPVDGCAERRWGRYARPPRARSVPVFLRCMVRFARRDRIPCESRVFTPEPFGGR